ncbi:MAG: hypothetical protein GY810_13595 [Aureispira sp.]|nr:hypothetical protein [Aureispira sp.]
MLHQILWKNRSRWQVVGASVGVFIGLFLLLFALQMYLDMQILIKGARDTNFLVLNKQFEKHLGEPLHFSDAEVKEVAEKPFISDLGEFTSNQFKAAISSNMLNFYTDLFFQSVPDHFLGLEDTVDFRWQGEHDEVPIVLSSDYLTLYNFGFAPSQGLPRLSVSTIAMVDFQIVVEGNGKRKIFKGYIYDLSRNVNSILVPKEFMDYANKEFGENKKPTTQLVVATDNPYNQSLNQFLDEKGYEVSRGGLIGGELKTALDILVLLMLAIGIIIVGLSLLVFMLNFQLLIAQASQDIQLLIQLGYSDRMIARTLASRLFKLFGIVVLSVFGVLVPAKFFITNVLTEQGYELSSFPSIWVWGVGLLFCAGFVWINLRSIQLNVRKLA